jgi:hypothetical protein
VNVIQPFQFLDEAFLLCFRTDQDLILHQNESSLRVVLLFLLEALPSLPTRAEKLIVHAVRYIAQFKKIKKPPRFPRLGVIKGGRLSQRALPEQLSQLYRGSVYTRRGVEVVAEDYFGEEEVVPGNLM